LRLTLLILGLVVIAGIYLWGTLFEGRWRPRNRRITPRDRQQPAESDLDLPDSQPQPFAAEKDDGGDDIYLHRALTDLNELVRESRHEPEIARLGSRQTNGPVQLDAFTDTPAADSEQRDDAEEQYHAAHDDRETAAVVEPSEMDAAAAYQDIIALYLVAPRDREYDGGDLRMAFERLGLRYGDMRIYHHFGTGKLQSRTPIYSVANLYEPGTFDPVAMDRFTTRGIALFMRTPGPVDGRVGFELMLSAAERLKELIGGEIQDEHHRPLTIRHTERLRERAGMSVA
jgi:cell division protein ZipA